MIELYVSGQSLRLATPVVAADSLGCLEARVHFTDASWDGLSKWLHFKRGDTVYDLKPDPCGRVRKEDGLNLTAGEWTVYLTGSDLERRATTVPVMLTVKESGLVDAPLHTVPLSALERLSYLVDLALNRICALQYRAGLVIRGFMPDAETLRRETPCPRAGDAYAVGAGAPYEVWIWDETGRRWVNAGALLQSVAQGPAGVTFVPSVDEAGNLSWTNDGELENPAARNIMGRTGAEGAVGPAGKSAYESACEAGYTGEEEAFLEALAVLPGHADRHGPGGPDPLVVRTGNLEDGAVTWEKIGTGGVRTENLADGAVTGVYTVSAGTGEAWRGESAPYTMTLAVPGLKETDRVIADLVPSGAPDVAQGELNAFSQIYKMETAADAVTLYAADRTSTGIVIQLLAVRR